MAAYHITDISCDTLRGPLIVKLYVLYGAYRIPTEESYTCTVHVPRVRSYAGEYQGT